MKSIVILSILCLSVVAGARLRRQINPNFGFPNFAFPQPTFNFQPGAPGTQTSFTSQTLNSRFGEDSQPVVTGQSTQFTSTGGQFQQTNTYIRPDGTVTSNKQSGRVRRQAPSKEEFVASLKQNEKPVSPAPVNPANPDLRQQSAPQPPVAQPTVTPQQNFQQQPNQPQQNFQQQHPQQQQQYPQQQPYPQQPNYQQQPYPQQPYMQGYQPANQFPFGVGFFGQPSFGVGFNQPGFGFAPIGFPQAGFAPAGVPQGIPAQGNFIGASQTLDNRFGEEEGVVTTGGSQFVTSQNGNYHITSSVLKPDGQVVTSQQSGTINKKP